MQLKSPALSIKLFKASHNFAQPQFLRAPPKITTAATKSKTKGSSPNLCLTIDRHTSSQFRRLNNPQILNPI